MKTILRGRLWDWGSAPPRFSFVGIGFFLQVVTNVFIGALFCLTKDLGSCRLEFWVLSGFLMRVGFSPLLYTELLKGFRPIAEWNPLAVGALKELLPSKAFLELVRVFFGDRIYDVKHLMKFCAGLHGGLDRASTDLGVKRAIGKSHQAWLKIKEMYFANGDPIEKYANVLYGLEVD
ncbi:hypothetical protein PVK06_036152 [Gossypium arboreum]|uniref:Uncharacterized protein n=1 Tax=Gossypium arboreum TaxID=29729 RepID=A0ABR0NIQ4_GOSAR|nr:hypothetical protein PVK06_036152 [Gossypium arboreum]